MKFAHYCVINVLLMALICCLRAAEQEHAPQIVRSQIIQVPPAPEPIVFPLRQAKIIIFMDDPEFAFHILTYLYDDSVIQRLEFALNVAIKEKTIINDANQFIAELNQLSQSERIIFTAGDNATKQVLNYLSKAIPQAGIVNSVILLGPTIAGERDLLFSF